MARWPGFLTSSGRTQTEAPAAGPVRAGDARPIDVIVVRIATAAAGIFMLGVVISSVAAGDASSLVRAVAPAAVASVGAAMLITGRPHAFAQLVVGMVGLVFIVAVDGADVPGEPLLGLLSMAIVGTVLVRNRRWLYIGISAPVVAYAGYAWQVTILPAADRLTDAAAVLVTYVIAASLLAWTQDKANQHHTQLERLILSKDEFLAAVSHELRTPLTTIMGLSMELQDRSDGFTAAEKEELVSLINTESQDVANIVEDLLVIGQDGLGQLQLESRTIDLWSEVAKATIGRQGVAIEPSAEVRLTAFADPGRTRQVLRNLVTNALRHGGPKVRIVARRHPEWAIIEVRDNGRPIPLEERTLMFLPYQRARAAEGTPGSVGLGLTVSQRLARLMGGDVEYHHDGRESVFSLVLPPGAAAANDRRGGEPTLSVA